MDVGASAHPKDAQALFAPTPQRGPRGNAFLDVVTEREGMYAPGRSQLE